MKYRRVNFYGGPGSGKSTASAKIFYELKQAGVTSEWVQEEIKLDAYRGFTPEGYDQFLLFAKHIQKEHTLLTHGVDVVVCDAPLFLGAFYTKKNKLSYVQCLEDMCIDMDNAYPSLNIFIERGNRKFNPKGRYQKRKDAVILDTEIKEYVQNYLGSLFGEPLYAFPGIDAAVNFALDRVLHD